MIHTPDYQGHDQVTHQTAFRVMHEEAISEPFLRLSSRLTFLAFWVSRRDQPGSKMIGEIFDDGGAFSENERLPTLGGHRDNRRLPKRVNLLQFRRRKHVLATLEGLDLIRDV